MGGRLIHGIDLYTGKYGNAVKVNKKQGDRFIFAYSPKDSQKGQYLPFCLDNYHHCHPKDPKEKQRNKYSIILWRENCGGVTPVNVPGFSLTIATFCTVC